VHIAEKAIAAVIATLTPDRNEKQVSADIEHEIRRFGGKGCSFEPIVGVGPRGALPHAPPTERQVGESDFVLIDWGARESLYVSDLTRIFVTGKISPKLERVYDVVLKAQRRAIESIQPGVRLDKVDTAARSVIEKAGWGKKFTHALGHGIGLEVHEAPRIGADQAQTLQAGMVVTVEPGIYLPGWGGVRIEDDILVTRDGHEVLSQVSKELEDCIVG
jgi:Xaa-Pro aminopeptidase